MLGVVSSGGVAKKRPRVKVEAERRISPVGPLVTVDDAWRKKLAGYLDDNDISTRKFAGRVKSTHGTISNIVNGRHPQVNKGLVERINAAMGHVGVTEVVQSDEAYVRIVEGALELDPEDRVIVVGLVERLRAAKKR